MTLLVALGLGLVTQGWVSLPGWPGWLRPLLGWGPGPAPAEAAAALTVQVTPDPVRPGERVDIRGQLSTNGRLPEAVPIGVTVRDPSGGVRFVDQVTAGPDGAFSSQFRLGPDAPLGRWRVDAAGAGASGSDTFLVVAPPSGGGGGGERSRERPPGEDPGTSTPVQGGTVTVSGEAVVLTVDAARLAQLVAAPGERVALSVPQVSGASILEVVFDGRALGVLQAAGKTLEVSAGPVVMSIPPAVLDSLSVDRGQTLALRVRTVADGDVACAAASPTGTDVVRAGPVLELESLIREGGQTVGQIETFSGPVEVAIAYDPGKLGGLNPLKLGIYRCNANTRVWEYVGGRSDPEGQVVRAARDSLSLYTVLAYDKTFADLANHWAREDIEIMAARHVVRGVTESAFAPERAVTRAEFAALVVRALRLHVDSAAPAGVQRFEDVDATAWFRDEVDTAAAAGIVQGVTRDRFAPDLPITREQMATMVSRALQHAGRPAVVAEGAVEVELRRFSDRAEISDWAKAGVASAVRAGIVRGRAESAFAPGANATRAESAVMLRRLLAYLGEL